MAYSPSLEVDDLGRPSRIRHLLITRHTQVSIIARYYHSLCYTYTYGDDPGKQPYRRIQFVHLIDGGLSDNLTARALLRTFDLEIVKALREKGIKRILLVQVNAKSDDARKLDLSSNIPSWIEVFKTVALNPIDVTTTLSSYISTEYWVSLTRYVNAEANKASHQTENVLRFFPVQVDFDQMTTNSEEQLEEQRYVKKIATDWSLSKEEVALVEETGKTLLTNHPCFKAFLLAAGSLSNASEAAPSECDKIDVSRRDAPMEAPAVVTAPEGVSRSADLLFDFNKVALKLGHTEKLDDLAAKLKGTKYTEIVVIGYADRSEDNKNKLSLRRGEAVKAYLVKEKGIPADKIFVQAKGEANPVTGDTCKGIKKTKALIECLQPDRRVEVEVAGTRETAD